MKIFFNRILLFIILASTVSLSGQEINSKNGYDTQIGVMIYMLEKLKTDIVSTTRGLNQTETDFQFDKKANSIGVIILHLAWAESENQVSYFGEEMRNEYNDEEKKLMEIAVHLDKANEVLKGNPIKYYLDLYKKVRKNTLKEFKKRNDDYWTKRNHYAWFHIMEHQAHHFGQIKLIMNRLPK